MVFDCHRYFICSWFWSFLYSDLCRELLQKEAEGLKQEAKEKEALWSQEKQQLQLEKDNHTQLIKELQNQLALSRQDTARVRYTLFFWELIGAQSPMICSCYWCIFLSLTCTRAHHVPDICHYTLVHSNAHVFWVTYSNYTICVSVWY